MNGPTGATGPAPPFNVVSDEESRRSWRQSNRHLHTPGDVDVFAPLLRNDAAVLPAPNADASLPSIASLEQYRAKRQASPATPTDQPSKEVTFSFNASCKSCSKDVALTSVKCTVQHDGLGVHFDLEIHCKYCGRPLREV